MQAQCSYGRESFDSWGRKKRSVTANAHNFIETENEDSMRLSREIIVLDYGDEKNSPYDDVDNGRGEDELSYRMDGERATGGSTADLGWEAPARAMNREFRKSFLKSSDREREIESCDGNISLYSYACRWVDT